MNETTFTVKGDLSEAFHKLKARMFINVNGVLVELKSIFPPVFKWGEHIGTFPEVAAKIREAQFELRKSIERAVDAEIAARNKTNEPHP